MLKTKAELNRLIENENSSPPGDGPEEIGAGAANEGAGPENDDTGPENDDTGPENDDTGPENDDTGPENDDTSPENDDTGPENDDTSPENDDTSPANEGAGATESSLGPEYEGAAASGNNVAAPSESGIYIYDSENSAETENIEEKDPAADLEMEIEQGNDELSDLVEPEDAGTNEKKIHLVPVKELINGKTENKFIKKLLNKDMAKYFELVNSLEPCMSWREAAEKIDIFFAFRGIDPMSKLAEEFRVLVQKRYEI